MIPWWYSPCQREQSKLSRCVQREGILRGCFSSVWKCDVMQRIKTWAWLSWMLGTAQSIPAIILFGSGSQPNSDLQVNNNVWISRKSGSKSVRAPRTWPEHLLAYWALAKLFKHVAKGNSQGCPWFFSAVLECNTQCRREKNTANVCKANWGWRRPSSFVGICVTLEGCWAEKN